MSYNLIVKPKLGKFLKNYEIVGQMDPYLRITVGNETYKSDVASKQGKTPVWKKTLNYKLSAEQNNQRDAVRVMIEAFDDDIGIDDFIGRYICTLSDVRIGAREITPFTLFDNKNNIVGTVEIEFDIKLEGDSTATLGKKALGTVVLRPVGAKFEQGHNEDEDVYLLLIHDDTAYQSTTSEGAGRKPIFRDIITFKQLEYEEITVQCFQNNSEPALMVGEGLIPVSSLQKRGGAHSLIVPLESGNRKIGELYIDVEFYNDVFEKPVRVYPILAVRKGEYLCKKFKYSNTDKVPKKLKLKSENRDLVYVKNDTVTVPPGTYAEVKIKIFAPTNGKVSEDKCRVDVIMEDKNQIEESLLFRIKAV